MKIYIYIVCRINPQHLSESFNKYFIDISKTLKTQSSTNFTSVSEIRPISKNLRSFYLFEISAEEVIKTVSKMENKSSFGYDGIPMTVIKKSIRIIAEPLAHIIYMAFKEGVFPQSLKIAVVKPFYKKGNSEDLENYRPISLLTSFSKVFERILVDRLLNFFHKSHIFSKYQHGFLRTKSTETAIFELTRSILQAVERGGVPVGLFIDFSRAFDCVVHNNLLRKLQQYGIRDKQLNLMRSYLENRRQRVSIEVNGIIYESSDELLEVGVPQGSIMGPLLFLIYINDLPENVMTHEKVQRDVPSIAPIVEECYMYADDTNLLITAPNIAESYEVARRSFSTVSNWCLQNQLYINSAKTQCVIFGTSHSKIIKPEVIELMGKSIKVSTSTNFLGIILDHQLCWSEHIISIRSKLNSVLYTLRILKQQADYDLLKTVYFSNFQSVLSYGIIMWGNSSDIIKIFVIQKRALRTMLGLSAKTSCRGHFKSQGILTTTGLYIFKCILFLKKYDHYFEGYRNLNNTRRIFPFHFPMCSLVLTQKNVEYMCLKFFNKLPKKLQTLSDFREFKNATRKLLLNLEPYSISEYLDNDLHI